MTSFKSTDLLAVGRASTAYKATFSSLKSGVLDSHIIQSATPPSATTHPSLVNGTIWIDTSKQPPQSHVWDAAGGSWQATGGGGGGGGGGSIDVPPANVPGSVIITENTTFRSDTQKIEFQLATANADTDPWHDTLTAAGGVFIRVRWKPNAFNGAAHGSAVTENFHMDLQFSGTKSSVFTWKVDKVPQAFTLTPASDVAFPAPVACADTITVSKINAPARVWATTDGGATEASIAGGAWVTLTADPATTPALVRNGQTLQLRHTTRNGALLVTTSKFFVGWDAANSVSADFVTTNVDSGVVKPAFTAPANNATGIALSPTLVGNAYVAIGAGGTHLNTDWEIASDAGFTTVVSQSLADATNKTSWTASGLASATFYFARFRYRGSGGVVSDWSDVITFETSHFLPPLVNSNLRVTVDDYIWTVPALIGTVKVTLNGANGGGSYTNPDINKAAGLGGKVVATFSVVPGEKIRFNNFGGSWAFGMDGGSRLTQSTLLAVVGSGGNAPRNRGNYGGGSTDVMVVSGGRSHGGGDTGDQGIISTNNDRRYALNPAKYNEADYRSRAAGGGSQTAGGAGGRAAGGFNPPPGGPLQGARGVIANNNTNSETGAGGSGWFGGGSGAASEYRNQTGNDPWNDQGWSDGNNNGWGGGGSSKVQLGTRLITLTENTKGTSDGSQPFIEY